MLGNGLGLLNGYSGLIALLLLVAVLPAGIITLRRRQQAAAREADKDTRKRKRDSFPEATLQEGLATVREKTGRIVQPGWQQMAYMQMLREVVFCLKNGEEIVLPVPAEVFDALEEGETGLLLRENGAFLDFGGRFGEPLEEYQAGKP